jgi:radical SAM-linked protein
VDPRPAEPRQRWRLVVAREEAARDLLHRDVITAWEAGLLASGLPVGMTETATPRPRITFAAPAQVGVLAERELIDVVLTGLRRIPDVRSAVAAAAPAGYRLVDLYDVWLSSPTLASLVTAADYWVTVAVEAPGEGEAGSGAGGVPSAGGTPSATEIEAAIGALLAAPRVEHLRSKGGADVAVDIRPHILWLRSGGAVSAAFELWMRLRLGGEGGVGRPDEIVAALGAVLGRRLVPRRIVRERIVLADDPDA